MPDLILADARLVRKLCPVVAAPGKECAVAIAALVTVLFVSVVGIVVFNKVDIVIMVKTSAKCPVTPTALEVITYAFL